MLSVQAPQRLDAEGKVRNPLRHKYWVVKVLQGDSLGREGARTII